MKFNPFIGFVRIWKLKINQKLKLNQIYSYMYIVLYTFMSRFVRYVEYLHRAASLD